jgi:hypothetical protein
MNKVLLIVFVSLLLSYVVCSVDGNKNVEIDSVFSHPPPGPTPSPSPVFSTNFHILSAILFPLQQNVPPFYTINPTNNLNQTKGNPVLLYYPFW